MKEKREKVIQIFLGTLIPIVYAVIYIPPEVTITQIISAGFIFYSNCIFCHQSFKTL